MASRAEIDGAWRELTAASAGKDGTRALAAVGPSGEVGLLQAAASAVMIALAQKVPGASSAAGTLAAKLRQRAQDGDLTLADQLTALEAGPVPGRQTLVVELDGLIDVMAGGGGYLDVQTGTSWPQELVDFGDGDDVPDPEDDPDRWLYVPSTSSAEAWADMADFTETLDDQDAVRDLQGAIEGRGAFARFQSTLDRHEQWRAAWRVFTHERQAARAREWLSSEGYDHIP